MFRQPVPDIVNQLGAGGAPFTNRDVALRTGTSRQAVHRQLAQLVRAGVLAAEGRGRATTYRLITAPASAPPSPVRRASFERTYPTAGLREDEVWGEVAAALPALALPGAQNAGALTAYALTEMVNNAIDHSGAAKVTVRAGGDAGVSWFEVRDRGVGALENVRAALHLPDHLTALQELSKGKFSTQPDRHSGEGLFFTSKMADLFELEANGLAWLVDNRRVDHAIRRVPPGPGTSVLFEVALAKRERPEEVFARYTHDFEFDTTRTVVKLFEYGVRFVSRSEAKRLLEGLERFRHVVLDFAGVEAVGQGFADEVFRVWARAHPDIDLQAEHMVEPVAFMIGRAQAARAADASR